MSAEKIMEQAQVFASAWSVVGGPFDDGAGHETEWVKEQIHRQAESDVLSDLLGSLKEVCETFSSTNRLWKDTAVHAMAQRSIARAEAAMAELEGQEPVAWVEVVSTHEGPYNFEGMALLGKGNHLLYARPVPAESGDVMKDLLEALKLAECVYRKNVVNEGEPSSVLEAMQAAITAAEAQLTDYPSTVDRAWARFCGAFGDGPDAPYPGMIAAFETHYGQSFRDKEWRTEAACWAAAWSKAAARAESSLSAPQSDALEQVRAEEREACAKLCESRQTPGTGSVAILQGAADAIRARGQG